jgi:hypothetical protein
MPTRPTGNSSRPLLLGLSAEQQLELILETKEAATFWRAANGLTEAIGKLRKKLAAGRFDDARELAEAIDTQLDGFLNELPERFGGRVVLKKVQCPVCQGTKRVQTRTPILRWETCPRCLGHGQVYPPARKKTIDLSHWVPKNLSRLQRAILLIAQSHAPEEGALVPTKQIRRELRKTNISTTDSGFSKALARLQDRDLLWRARRLSGAWEGKTVAVGLKIAGEMAARALRQNG